MKTISKALLWDYSFCAAIFVLAFIVAIFGGECATFSAQLIAWLSIVGVGLTTFRWARLRGYPAKDRSGKYAPRNIFRALVMTAVMTYAVAFPGGLIALFMFVGGRT